jgi:hypothetical protein
LKYETLNDVVSKGSINVSLNKILDDDGYHPVFEYDLLRTFHFISKRVLSHYKDGAGIREESQNILKVFCSCNNAISDTKRRVRYLEYFLNKWN